MRDHVTTEEASRCESQLARAVLRPWRWPALLQSWACGQICKDGARCLGAVAHRELHVRNQSLPNSTLENFIQEPLLRVHQRVAKRVWQDHRRGAYNASWRLPFYDRAVHQ
jgi:hypothetical protein